MIKRKDQGQGTEGVAGQGHGKGDEADQGREIEEGTEIDGMVIGTGGSQSVTGETWTGIGENLKETDEMIGGQGQGEWK